MGLRRRYYEESEPNDKTSAVPPLLRVEKVSKHFPVRGGLLRRKVGAVRAVDEISFSLAPEETVAIVGGPGSGKTTLGRTIIQLEQPTAGRVYLRQQEISRLGKHKLRRVRREMGMLFQNPYASLSPSMRLREIIAEPLRIHQMDAGSDAVAAALVTVGLNPYFADRYPFEFSGGMRQRINISRVLASRPALVVLDEPLAALDPLVRPQLRTLLMELKTERNLSYLWLSRDLGAVLPVSDRVGILYMGKLAEMAPADRIADQPLHPYTQFLRSTIPLADPEKEQKRQEIELRGGRPDPQNPPSGCQFHPRCPYATAQCKQETPALRNLGGAQRPHLVACHHAEKFLEE